MYSEVTRKKRESKLRGAYFNVLIRLTVNKFLKESEVADVGEDQGEQSLVDLVAGFEGQKLRF